MGFMTTPSDSITLTVTEVPRPEDDHGSVVIFSGIDTESGENYFFAVDHRPAAALLSVLDVEGEIDVAIEPWQVLAKGAF